MWDIRYLYSFTDHFVIFLNDPHFISSEDAHFFKYLREGVLSEGVGMEEDGGNDFQVLLDLIENVMFIENNGPGLHPSRNR